MRKDALISIIYIIIGIGIIGLWIMLLGTSQVPELETEPIAIVFHIVIECIMGVLSILSGIWLFRQRTYYKQLILFTNGLLVYSVVNSSGYYGDQGEVGMIIMFGLILGFVLYSSFYMITSETT